MPWYKARGNSDVTTRGHFKTVLHCKRGQAPLPEDVFGRETTTGATEPVPFYCRFEMRSSCESDRSVSLRELAKR
jgi:hypothetical protein